MDEFSTKVMLATWSTSLKLRRNKGLSFLCSCVSIMITALKQGSAFSEILVIQPSS
jgi:hypothetical protein